VIVAHCKSGARSAKAVRFLRQTGFMRVSNLTGGILNWADRFDPSLPKYWREAQNTVSLLSEAGRIPSRCTLC
jgi:predicted sulfurtransferase